MENCYVRTNERGSEADGKANKVLGAMPLSMEEVMR